MAAWDKKSDLISEYCRKGDKLYVEVKLQTRSWEDNDGVKKYSTEIVITQVVFLGNKNNNAAPNIGEPVGVGAAAAITDDELPF